MMPKISGFEMLDILRNTDGLKDVKVIMLTALGQSDDQQRADRLGADSYLVKSQVTLEDIVKVAGRLLGSEDTADTEATAAVVDIPAPIVNTPVTTEPVAVVVASEPVAPLPPPPPLPEPSIPIIAPDPVTPAPMAVLVDEPSARPEPIAPIAFGAPAPITPEASQPTPVAPAVQTDDATFLQSLGASTEAVPIPAAQPLAEEAATVEAQIASFEKAASPAPTEVVPNTPAAEAPALADIAAPLSPAPTATEQFVTTTAPDLTTTVDPTAPTAQSAGNDDVLANALQSLTGQPPEAITVKAVPPVVTAPADTEPTVAHGGNRVIAPLNTPSKPDLSTLLALEEAKEIANAPLAVQVANTTITATTIPATAVPEVTPGAAAPVTQPFDPNNIAL